MGKKAVAKHTAIILTPLVLGFIVSTLHVAEQLFINLIWVFSLCFITFWFWAGQKTYDDYPNKIKGVFIENSVWILSLLVFVWQFCLIEEAQRILPLASASLYYVVFMIPIPSLFYISNEVIPMADATLLTLLSFVLMLVIFLGGYFERLLVMRRKRRIQEKKPAVKPGDGIAEVEKRIEKLYGHTETDAGTKEE